MYGSVILLGGTGGEVEPGRSGSFIIGKRNDWGDFKEIS